MNVRTLTMLATAVAFATVLLGPPQPTAQAAPPPWIKKTIDAGKPKPVPKKKVT